MIITTFVLGLGLIRPQAFYTARCRASMMTSEAMSELLPKLPQTLAESLRDRGLGVATPIQAAAIPRANAGESLLIHSETGSGKTLAFLLPALSRAASASGADGVVLILSPTRELCVQLADEARLLLQAGWPEVSPQAVTLVAQGYTPKAAALASSRVVIGTPAELLDTIASGGGDHLDEEAASSAGRFAETLGSSVSTLVLDEVDALVPGKKEFRGKRHGKWMDKGMHPAEAVVKLLARRSSRADFQLIAGSATLDQATRRKISKLLRACKPLQARGAPRALPLISTAPATMTLREDDEDEDRSAEESPKRWTAVPSGIEHRTRVLPKFDGLGGTEPACDAVVEVLKEREEAAASGGVLIFVSSRSTYLGGAHTVAKELRRKGVEDAVALSDALWPGSTRARKRKKPKGGSASGSGALGAGAGAAEKATPEAASTSRRAALNAQFGTAEETQILVADAAATRGLHLDGVSTVIILGLPANPQTYLHLAGRTGRGTSVAAPGEAVVVTVAIGKEMDKLKTWGNMLSIKID